MYDAKLSEVLLCFGFRQHDYSLFMRKTDNNIIAILVYVDDMLITGSHLELIESTKLILQQAFKMKDLGEIKYFPGIEFVRSKDGLLMHYKKYALELICDLGLGASKPAGTLLEVNTNITTK